MLSPISGNCLRLSRVVLLLGTLWIGAWALAGQDKLLSPGVVTVLKGHTETVYAVAFSSDGKLVATGSFDKSLKLWETASGKEVKTFGGQGGHQNLVLSVAFSPDGKALASGASDNTAKLWDVPMSAPLLSYAHSDAINSLTLTPDGTKLAGAGRDGSVKVWNTSDGKQLFNLTGHTGPVTAAACSANGQVLISAGSDKTVRFWNLTNGQPLGVVGAHGTPVNAVAFNPNNTVAYSAGDDGLVKACQVPPPAPRSFAAQDEAVTALALSADGNQAVTGSADKSVRLFSFGAGQQVRQFTGPAAGVLSVALAPNGALIAAGTADNRLAVWNASDGKLLGQVAGHSGPVTGLAFHPQSSMVLTGCADGFLRLWAMPLQPARGQFFEAHPGGVSSVAFHSNGSHALSGGMDKNVKLWNFNSGQVERTFGPLADPVSAVAFSRDFARVGAAAGNTVKVWNGADGKELLNIPHSAQVTSLSFSPDNTKLVTGTADHLVRVWNAGSGKELQWFAHAGPVRSVVFHTNNTMVLSCGGDKTVAVNTLAVQNLLVASANPIRSLAVTANGSHVLTVGDDRLIRLWNVGNGANERTYSGAEGPIQAVALSKNGAVLAAGGADKAVRLYNFADGKPLGAVAVPAAVRGLAFSPNNQTLAVACNDNSLLTLNVTYNPGQPPPPTFGKSGQAFSGTEPFTDVAFGPDNATLYAASVGKTVQSWRFAGEAPAKNFGHPNFVDAVAFNPAGTQLASGSHDGTVRVWDIAKGNQVRQIDAHAKPAVAPVYCVAWNRDGSQLVSGSLDRTVKLWDATSGNLVREFKAYKEKEFEKGHRDGVFCVAFSPDGKLLASGSSDHTIKIWNVADGSVARELANPNLKSAALSASPSPASQEGNKKISPPSQGEDKKTPAPSKGEDKKPSPPSEGGALGGWPLRSHPGWVYSLAFTPDGKHLVSVGNAPRNHGYLAVWDVADGKLISGEELPLGAFYSVAVSPDGKLLAVGCGPQGRQFQDVSSYILKLPLP